MEGKLIKINPPGTNQILASDDYGAGDRTMRNGRRNKLRRRCKIPSTAIPRMRNGSNSSQTIGYMITARIATGQQMIKRIIHTRKVSIHAPELFPLPYVRRAPEVSWYQKSPWHPPKEFFILCIWKPQPRSVLYSF
jgi:hypothetical protein